MQSRHLDIPIMPANPTARRARPQSIPDTKVTQTLDSVKAALMTFPYIDLAILFGSMAKGTQRPDSDVDVGVLSKTPLNVEQRMELVDALALALGRPVDLIDLKLAGQPILNQILKHGVRICGSDTQMADLVYRNLVDRADFLPLRNRILKGQQDAWMSK